MSFRDPSPVNIPGSNPDPVGFAINSKIMLTTIIVILFVVVLMVYLHLYSRWYLLRSRRFNLNRRTSAAIIFFADPSSTSVVNTHGLDSSVIKSLPIFTFSTATAPNGIECAVCLSEFEESESGRVLPNCKHTFHVDCIDMWFHSHSSCPLCRSLVEPIVGGVISAGDEVMILISDPVPGDTDRLGGMEISDNSAPDDSRRKPAAIEVPRRSDLSRVISFTRILSREWRSPSSSSNGFPPAVSPPACSMSATELDIELGREETR